MDLPRLHSKNIVLRRSIETKKHELDHAKEVDCCTKIETNLAGYLNTYHVHDLM